MADMQDDVDMSTLTDNRDTMEMDWEPAPTPSTRCKRTLDDLYESSAVENSPAKRMRNVRRTLRPVPKLAACSMVQLINNAIRHGPRSTAQFVRNIPYTLSTIRFGVPRVSARIYNRVVPSWPAPVQAGPSLMPGSFPVTPQRSHAPTPAEASTAHDDGNSRMPDIYTINEAALSQFQPTSTLAMGTVETENDASTTHTTTTPATQTDNTTNGLIQDEGTRAHVPSGANADAFVAASSTIADSGALQSEEEHPNQTASPTLSELMFEMPTPDPGPAYHAWAAPPSEPKRIPVARDSPIEGQALFEKQSRPAAKISKTKPTFSNADIELLENSPTRPYSFREARAHATRPGFLRPRYTKISDAYLTAEERAKTRPARPVLEERNLNVSPAEVPDSPLTHHKSFNSKAMVNRAQTRVQIAEENKRRAAEKKQADVAARIARVEEGFAKRAKETAEAKAKRFAEAEAEEKAKAKEEADAKAKAEAEEKARADAEDEAKAKAEDEDAIMHSSAPTLRLGIDNYDDEPLPDVLSAETLTHSRENMNLYRKYNYEADEIRKWREEDPDVSMIEATPVRKLRFHPGSAFWIGQYPAEYSQANLRQGEVHPYFEVFPSNIREFDTTYPVTDVSDDHKLAHTPRLRPEHTTLAVSPANTDASPIRLPNHPADSPMIRSTPKSTMPSRLDQIRADAGVAARPATTDASPNSDSQHSGNKMSSTGKEPAQGGGPTTPARQTGTRHDHSEDTPIQGITAGISNFFFTPSKSSGGRAQAVETSRASARRESERQAAIRAEKERKRLEEQRKKEEAERRARASIIVKLTPDMEKSVDGALAAPGMNKQCGMVTRKDLGTLLPQTSGEGIGWLNDEIVNKYLEAVVDRAREKAGNPKVAREPGPVRFKTMGSFMYTQYMTKKSAGLEQFKGWNRRPKLADEGLLQCEKVLIPINANSHWTLLVVSPPSRTITYYDSLGGLGANYTQFALDWVKMTMGGHFVADEWKIVSSRSSKQMNGLDCGVFVCMNGMAVCRGVEPTDAFDDRSVGAARRQIAATLVDGGFKGVLGW